MKEEVQSVLGQVYSQSITITSSQSIGGGSINDTVRMSLSNGEKVFVKFNSQPPPNFFFDEAKGLKILASAKEGPRIPRVIALQQSSNPNFLILEYIEQAATGKDYYFEFARSLANMHRTTQDVFGLDHNNYIGSTPQINTEDENALTFFKEQRLQFQQSLARKNNRLPKNIDHKIDKLCEKLENFLDLTGENPALVHGDLWSGNHFSDGNGTPCIFDPAVYFGLREADLAMTELFGKMPETFYQAYHECFPLNPGYENRKQIYNLYHLLNHVNLFGGSYLSSVESTLNYFVG